MLTNNPLENMRVTSKFGMRVHPITKKDSFHNGIDFGSPANTPIHSVADGKVIVSQFSKSVGNYIIIQHKDFLSVYCHMIAKGVDVGKIVKSNDIIGKVGSTGSSTAAHLHFEIRTGQYTNAKEFWSTANGKYPNSIDPEPLLIIEQEYEKILKSKTTNPNDWIEFVKENKNHKTGKWLPQLIEKLSK